MNPTDLCCNCQKPIGHETGRCGNLRFPGVYWHQACGGPAAIARSLDDDERQLLTSRDRVVPEALDDAHERLWNKNLLHPTMLTRIVRRTPLGLAVAAEAKL